MSWNSDHQPANVNPKRIALLHVARKQLSLDEDSYRAILQKWGGVDSSAKLSSIGFECVMMRMEQLGFRSTWTKRTFGDRHPDMASASQVNLIRTLWEEYSPGDIEEAGLNGWLSNFHRFSALRFVSSKKAQPVITALRAMIKRKRTNDV